MRPWLFWPAAYFVTLALATLVGWPTIGVGNAVFLAGAGWIVASVGFIGAGGERRLKLIRNIFGIPIAAQVLDPEKREKQISTGVKVFLVGLALWLPLIVVSLSGT